MNTGKIDQLIPVEIATIVALIGESDQSNQVTLFGCTLPLMVATK